MTAAGATSYKEYLRSQFIYKDFKDLNLRSFPALPKVDYLNRPQANLCQFHFVEGHECMFGAQHCIYAHSIKDI